ncbi:unnamed protein product, partial [Discosporangium mesarthrocarpum]
VPGDGSREGIKMDGNILRGLEGASGQAREHEREQEQEGAGAGTGEGEGAGRTKGFPREKVASGGGMTTVSDLPPLSIPNGSRKPQGAGQRQSQQQGQKENERQVDSPPSHLVPRAASGATRSPSPSSGLPQRGAGAAAWAEGGEGEEEGLPDPRRSKPGPAGRPRPPSCSRNPSRRPERPVAGDKGPAVSQSSTQGQVRRQRKGQEQIPPRFPPGKAEKSPPRSSETLELEGLPSGLEELPRQEGGEAGLPQRRFTLLSETIPSEEELQEMERFERERHHSHSWLDRQINSALETLLGRDAMPQGRS